MSLMSLSCTLSIVFGVEQLLTAHRTDALFIGTRLAVMRTSLMDLRSANPVIKPKMKFNPRRGSKIPLKRRHSRTQTHRHARKVCPTGSNLVFAAVNALFSFSFRPPPSVVFLAPTFHGSGVMTLDNFFSHLSQTISNQINYLVSFKFTAIHV